MLIARPRLALAAILCAFFLFLMESAQANPERASTFVYNHTRPLKSVNVFTQTGYVMTDLKSYVFDRLVYENAKTGKIEPRLAERWKIFDGGKRIRFWLRPNAKFHDGEPVTAEDVKFTWEAHGNPEYKSIAYSPIRKSVTVKIIDPHTVDFHLTDPSYAMFFTIARWTDILPKHFYGDVSRQKEWGTKQLGSGPYRMKRFQRSKRAELERNSDWFGFQDPKLQDQYVFPRVTMRFITEVAAVASALKKGEIDYAQVFEPEEFNGHFTGSQWGAGKSVRAVQTEANRLPGRRAMDLNLRNPIFADRETRQALLYLFDRESVAEKVYSGTVIPGITPWHQRHPAPAAGVKAIPFDREKALELLREAGWQDTDQDGVLDRVVDGKKQNFRFSIVNYKKDRERLLTTMAEQAKGLGIQITVRTLEAQAAFRLAGEVKFDAFYLQTAFSMGDFGLYTQFHSSFADSDRPINRTGFKNAEADKLLERLRMTFDRTKRKPLLERVGAILATELPVLPIFDDRFVMYGVSSRVKREADTYPFGVGKEYWRF